MDIKKRLDALPEEVVQTFHRDFVFLIFPEKVQHLPARDWDQKETLNYLYEKLGKPLSFDHWRNFLISYHPEKELIILIPRFQELNG